MVADLLSGTGNVGLDEGAGACVVVTHPSGTLAKGQRIDVPSAGLSIGASPSELVVSGADATGTRVEIRRLGSTGGDLTLPWRLTSTTPVRVNDQLARDVSIESGDDLRVADSFFRFLSGERLQQQYYETIYQLTLFDFATRLGNVRQLNEVLRNTEGPMSLAVVSLTCVGGAGAVANHDLLAETLQVLRKNAPASWTLYRTGDLELAMIAPDKAVTDVERQLGEWFSAQPADSVSRRFAVAEQSGDNHDLLSKARARMPQKTG